MKFLILFKVTSNMHITCIGLGMEPLFPLSAFDYQLSFLNDKITFIILDRIYLQI